MVALFNLMEGSWKVLGLTPLILLAGQQSCCRPCPVGCHPPGSLMKREDCKVGARLLKSSPVTFRYVCTHKDTLCVYVCIYIYMCIHVYTYMYIYICKYIRGPARPHKHKEPTDRDLCYPPYVGPSNQNVRSVCLSCNWAPNCNIHIYIYIYIIIVFTTYTLRVPVSNNP